MSAPQLWRDLFAERAAALPGARLPWLARLRGQAIERFAEEGWPTRRLDAWRHTPLALLGEQAFVAADGRAEVAAAVAQLHREAGAPEHWLVFVDGHHRPDLSTPGGLPQGCHAGSLAEALTRDAPELEALMGRAEEGGSPAALNLAFAADGAYVRIGSGVAIESPLHLVFLSATAQAATHVRNLVQAGANSVATIVEHHVGLAEAQTLATVETRLALERDARVTHLKLQRESGAGFHLARIDAQQAGGSVFDSHSLSFGARLARTDIETRFAGEGCEALFNGLYHADGRRHVDHHTRIDHAQPRGTSREYYRGILDGAARGVFSGRILVAPGAVRTDAVQRTDNLLLSAQAEADARPELEIYAADVKCAHGATVGQLDEEALFYLRARGLDEAHARKLLTLAFAGEVLERIRDEALRRCAREILLARLPGEERMEESYA